MAFNTRVREAVSPITSMIRPPLVSVLAVVYGIAGVVCLALAALAPIAPEGHPLGTFLLPPELARAFFIAFGAGLVYVAHGFWHLRARAWVVYVCAMWTGVVLETLWLLASLSHGPAAALGYLPRILVDAALLFYIHRQRRLFTN